MPRWPVVLALALLSPASAPAQDAKTLVANSLAAIGGDQLEHLQGIRLTGIATVNALEQSERPEGPWIPTYEQTVTLRDLDDTRVRTSRRGRSVPWSLDWGPEIVTIADTGAAVIQLGPRSGPGGLRTRDDAIRDLRLAPERLLLTAQAAPDLRRLPDTVLAGVSNHRVAFSLDRRSVEVVIDAVTLVPAGYILRGPSWSRAEWVWGDATIGVWFSLWGLESPGIRYPRMLLEEFNGQASRQVVYTGVEFDPTAPADSFAIADSTRAAFAGMAARSGGAPDPAFQIGRLRGREVPPIEPASGITILPGTWYTAIVRQADGLVILEAPISSRYSTEVLAEAARRYPGVPVRAVVTTSDAWPHLGGVREYVARGIPVYHLDLNRPILSRLVAAPFTTHPDSLARSRTAPHWRPVSQPGVLGTGPNRLQLIPVRGEGAERMMMAYFPEHRLLYASDLVQRQEDGSFFWPEYLAEVVEAVDRHGLAVERVYAMHSDPLPWSEIREAVAQAWGR